jgi:hypothetical protein
VHAPARLSAKCTREGGRGGEEGARGAQGSKGNGSKGNGSKGNGTSVTLQNFSRSSGA